ncbi:hypothetical protein GGR21_003601 [Dysgonomonas hofstadii]|uniref:Uncharacterized protein n=1 Tax=Dysgonomonas hofstadii TaxID=637886 RepID=A0A840CNU7_9BACT|nr:hypothetical protein [Dysgonomonas hofstadii]MBB4037680.1 hypothetical protein [Dysgonomonas hofstadii]
MNKINKISVSLISGLLMIMSLSCSDDDNWSPGPEVDPSSPRVYFNPSSSGDVEPGESYLNIAVSRVNTNGSLTVPISISKSTEGLLFPDQSVTFAAGEETAYFKVGFNQDIPYETDYPFELKIDEVYSDQYIAAGAPVHSGKLRRLEPWVFVAEATCTFEGTSGSKLAAFDPFKQNLYKKEIAGIFKIENWCLNGTGEWYGDFIFTVDENKQILPDSGIGFHDISAKRWYFYEPGKASSGDDTKYQINGHLPTSTGVYMTYFYLYTIGSTSSSYFMDFDESARTAKMGGYSRYSSSTFSSGSFVLNYTW